MQYLWELFRLHLHMLGDQMFQNFAKNSILGKKLPFAQILHP